MAIHPEKLSVAMPLAGALMNVITCMTLAVTAVHHKQIYLVVVGCFREHPTT